MDPDEHVPIPREEAAKRACAAFKAVFANGHKVELDHYIVYNARKQKQKLKRRNWLISLAPNRLRVWALTRVHG